MSGDDNQAAEPHRARRFSGSRVGFDDGASQPQYVRLQRYKSQVKPAAPSSEPEPISLVVVDNDLTMRTCDKVKVVGEEAEVESIKAGQRRSGGTAQSLEDASEQDGVGAGPSPLADNMRRLWATRIWPALRSCYSQDFADPDKERQYQREAWLEARQGALWAALFFIVTWICFCAFMQTRVMIYWVSCRFVNVWTNRFQSYIAICGAFTLPLPFLVAWDVGLRFPLLYQLILLASVWTWPVSRCLWGLLTATVLSSGRDANVPRTSSLFPPPGWVC